MRPVKDPPIRLSRLLTPEWATGRPGWVAEEVLRLEEVRRKAARRQRQQVVRELQEMLRELAP